MSQSTNNHDPSLAEHMNRLSLSTAASAALPPSSPVAPPAGRQDARPYASPATPIASAKTTLRRAPSSSSIGSNKRAATPTLRERTSMSSLHGGGSSTPPRSPAIRRTSAQFPSSPNTNTGGRSSLAPPMEEPPKPPMTAATVAHDFFEKDLMVNHSGSEIVGDAQTVVILQDDCYGHRYSRPRTSKANLSTIVERPERIHASILGMATAYVRLGGRHVGGTAAPHPERHPTSLPPIPFKIHKTTRRLSLKSAAASAIHGAKWMDELSAMCDVAESKLALSGKELTRIPATEGSNGNAGVEKAEFHEGDLYLCSGSLNALEGALGGVCEAVDIVFKERGAKRAFVCIRPPGHHCSADMPSGFCWLNNVHVGIGHAATTHGLTHAAIIDFDLHHGDGSQSITWEHNSRMASLPKNTPLSKKTAIGYFSLHDINSYPCEMGDEDKIRNASLCIENAHGQSIWNVHLQSWKTEKEFWSLYEDRYLTVLAKARAFLRAHSDRLRLAPTHPKPKAAIFLSAGFDASEWESPGMQRHQVNVPTSFYARFTRDVVIIAQDEALAVDGRVVSVLEGGYSDRALMSGVLSHITGLTASTNTSTPLNGNGLAHEMGRRLGNLDLNMESEQDTSAGRHMQIESLDDTWWSPVQLEEIETLVNPPTVAAAPKRQRNNAPPTYTSATQSFAAKIVSPPQGRRSFSSSSLNFQNGGYPGPRPPSPPPEPVNWATAAHELSKLLVPSDRETRSCRPEELNAEASRVRRDRFSSIGLPPENTAPDHGRMQLRDKRNKQPTYAVEEEEEDKKLVSRASRRKTVADVNLLAEEKETLPTTAENPEPMQVKRPTRRRSSIASSIASMSTDKTSEFSVPSVAGSQARKDSLLVKKARVPSTARAEVPKPRPAKKPPAATRMPSLSSTTTKPQQAPAQAVNGETNVKLSPSVNDELKSKDVDQLASAVRQLSIKLNVPPKEEYEARQPKGKAVPRGRPVKTTTPKTTQPGSSPKGKARAATEKPTQLVANGTIASETKSIPDMGARDELKIQTSTTTPSNLPQTITDPMLSDPQPRPSIQQPEPELPTPTAIPESTPPLPAPTQQQQPQNPTPTSPPTSLPPLPASSSPTPTQTTPTTTTTIKRTTKHALPIFTPTTPLSFAKPQHHPPPTNPNQSATAPPPPPPSTTQPSPPSFAPPPPQGKPATEPQQQQQQQQTFNNNNNNSNNNNSGAQPPSSSSEMQNHVLKKQDEEMGSETESIWDFPDTPQARLA